MRCAVCADIVAEGLSPQCDGCKKCVCVECNVDIDSSQHAPFRCSYCTDLPGDGVPINAAVSFRRLGLDCMGKSVEFAQSNSDGTTEWVHGTLTVSDFATTFAACSLHCHP